MPACWAGGKGLQFNAVEERNPRIIAATSALVTVVKNPLLPVLKEDSDKTQSPRQIGRPGLDHDPAPPGSIILVKHFVSHPEISVFSIRLLRRECPGRYFPGFLLKHVLHVE